MGQRFRVGELVVPEARQLALDILELVMRTGPGTPVMGIEATAVALMVIVSSTDVRLTPEGLHEDLTELLRHAQQFLAENPDFVQEVREKWRTILGAQGMVP